MVRYETLTRTTSTATFTIAANKCASGSRATGGVSITTVSKVLNATITLADAQAVVEAGLYFETHEVLEPFWTRALGAEREALQGLIQVAVGFQHLANGNLDGARALLRDGATKLAGHRLGRRATSVFAAEVARCLGEIIALGADAQARFDWSRVPRFPAED